MKTTMKQQFFFWIAIALMATFPFKAVANNTYYYKANASASPTGAGKVYVSKTEASNPTLSESSTTGTFSTSETKQTIYLYAAPNEGYKFLRWTNGATVVGSNRNMQATISSSSTTEASPTESNFTANFVKTKVTVKSQDEKYCQVAIDKEVNDVGDVVTLTATLISNHINPLKFTGWSLNGKIVSHDLVYSVQVTEDAEYTATFAATGQHPIASGMYCRVKSKKEHNLKYVSVIGTSYRVANKSSEGFAGAICDKSIILAPDDSAVFSDAGTVAYISGTQNGDNVKDASLKAQGVGSKDLQSYASLSLWYDNGYLLAGNLSGSRYFKHGGNYGYPCIIICGGDDGADVRYDIEPLDEEHIDTYYFGAVPSAGTTDGACYYTTLYTAFPYQCHDGVKAYIVAAIDNGKVYLQEIGNGRVPAYTPVVLQCKGTTARENRLVPIIDNIPASIPGCDTYLKGKIDINDGKGDASFRTAFDPATMRVLSDSGLEFANQNNGGDTYIKTNTCYLQANDLTSDSYTLAFDEGHTTLLGLVATGSAGKDYTVTGKDLELVTDFQAQNGDGYLVVKDNDQAMNNYVAESEMSASTYLIEGRDQKAYPQNNWLLVKCAPELYATFKQEKKQVTSITGQYIDPTNPTLAATGLVTGEPAEYTPNTYCATNFMGSPTVHTGEQATQPGEYFFMTPKPCEWIKMVYAVPSEDCMTFYVPVRNGNGTINGHDFSGGVRANWDYNIKPLDATLKSALSPTGAYAFHAIVKRVPSPAGSPAIAPKEGSISSQFVIYPLDITAGIMTGVSDVQGSKTVTRVRYYSLQGVESKRPHEGINVVVTTYSDGSRQVTKRKY